MTRQEEQMIGRLYREIENSREDIHKKIVRLGKLLAKYFSADDSSLEEFCLRYPYMKLANLQAYIGVSEERIYAPLLASSEPAVRRALKLPYDLQKTVWHEGVEVWVSSTQKAERKHLMAMTEGEAARAFRHNKINTVAQQRQMEERHVEVRAHGSIPRFFGDTIVIGKTTLTRQQTYDLMVKFWSVEEALNVVSRINAESSKRKKAA